MKLISIIIGGLYIVKQNVLKRFLTAIFFLILSCAGWAQERDFQIRNINNVEVMLGEITSVALFERNYFTPESGNNDLAVFGDLQANLMLIIGLKSVLPVV